MTIEKLKQLYETQPFKPFVIHLADGRGIPVHHRDFIMAVPSGAQLSYCSPMIL